MQKPTVKQLIAARARQVIEQDKMMFHIDDWQKYHSAPDLEGHKVWFDDRGNGHSTIQDVARRDAVLGGVVAGICGSL